MVKVHAPDEPSGLGALPLHRVLESHHERALLSHHPLLCNLLAVLCLDCDRGRRGLRWLLRAEAVVELKLGAVALECPCMHSYAMHALQ